MFIPDKEFQLKLAVTENKKQLQQKAFDLKFAEEKTKLKDDLEVNLRKSSAANFETKLQILEGHVRIMKRS
ncbi:hypothetical protein G6M26_35045 [Agrobacterium tumefaciens]|nr:hypothetical protein [Agrobacterium tumefaciens]NTE23771.1 hypothetical protein [Agrobacterium tumefaciens]